MAVLVQDLVDELSTIVRVQPVPLKRNPLPYLLQSPEAVFLRLPHNCFFFPPAGGNLSGANCIDIFPQSRGATMDNQISLYIAQLGGIPLGKPYGNLVFQQRAGFRATF